ncbi:hypothetical protein ABTY53_15850 [Streptomyces noursei]|uniref:hypothetical protein n=1 Tax=Streptomyces noursei TaxID=1971 RepID=UPI003322D90D
MAARRPSGAGRRAAAAPRSGGPVDAFPFPEHPGRAHFDHPAAWQDFAAHGFMVLKASAARLTVDVHTVDVATRRATLAHRTHSTRPVAPAARAAATA